MSQIEKEIKILDIEVQKIKAILAEKGVLPKGKYIQDVYTFDFLTVDQLYEKYTNDLIINNDSRGLTKLLKEIRPCFSNDDLNFISKYLGSADILEYISDKKDYQKLLSDDLVKIMKRINENFSKWIRLRRTDDQTTITIKKIINSQGEYELDAVEELEFDVPDIPTGLEFLEDLGYFFARHQIKMRIAYDYKNTEIVIDKWPKLDPYIEIEGNSKEDIDEVVKDLGFDPKDAIVINTDDVYLKIGINIYDEEHKDLSFSKEEQEEVDSYLS